MKKVFLSLSILLAGFSATKAQPSMHAINTTTCTVTFAVHGHDGTPNYPFCGMAVTTPITLGPGQSFLWNNTGGALNSCGVAPHWLNYCSTGNPMAASGSWDFIDQFSGPAEIFGPTPGCGGYPSTTTVPGCPSGTVTWTAIGANADVMFY